MRYGKRVTITLSILLRKVLVTVPSAARGAPRDAGGMEGGMMTTISSLIPSG
jgi:hypothetical protein